MTLPIRVHVDERAPSIEIMASCFSQLVVDGAVRRYFIELRNHRQGKLSYTLHPARGAKPFVLRTLREYAHIANTWE